MFNPGGQLPLRTLKAAVVGSCGFTLFLGACAIANTPQQDLAYARWAKCNAPFVQLEWVGLDGRITLDGAPMYGISTDEHVIIPVPPGDQWSAWYLGGSG